ncbi:hypothetical protein [Nocardia sp.]|uniref:hypothetical protein n=1 Tax=Nocardia sp. TaxID=1821 RepID=UPI002631A1B9|nr:hypothetical protein [Nocardia sp.]
MHSRDIATRPPRVARLADTVGAALDASSALMTDDAVIEVVPVVRVDPARHARRPAQGSRYAGTGKGLPQRATAQAAGLFGEQHDEHSRRDWARGARRD